MLLGSGVHGQPGPALNKDELLVLALSLRKCLLFEPCDPEQRNGLPHRGRAVPSEG